MMIYMTSCDIIYNNYIEQTNSGVEKDAEIWTYFCMEKNAVLILWSNCER